MDLRRFYIQQKNWQEYKKDFLNRSQLTKQPGSLKYDARRMVEMKNELKREQAKQSQIILPQINKRIQMRDRIMKLQEREQESPYKDKSEHNSFHPN